MEIVTFCIEPRDSHICPWIENSIVDESVEKVAGRQILDIKGVVEIIPVVKGEVATTAVVCTKSRCHFFCCTLYDSSIMMQYLVSEEHRVVVAKVKGR